MIIIFFHSIQFVINKFGRKLSLTGSLLICGITCISGGFIPEKVFWIQIILFLVGKMAITSAFTIVYVYSGLEIMRNMLTISDSF